MDLATFQFRLRQLNDLVDELVHRHPHDLDGMVLREEERFLHVGLDRAHVPEAGGQQFIRAIGAAVGELLCDLEVGGDRREQVVQVVRHAA